MALRALVCRCVPVRVIAREGGIPCCDTKAYAFLRSKNAKTARAGEAEGHKGSEKEEKGEERTVWRSASGGRGGGGGGAGNQKHRCWRLLVLRKRKYNRNMSKCGIDIWRTMKVRV